MEQSLNISSSLKYLFDALEKLLEIKFNTTILNTILKESRLDKVNSKHYTLNSINERIIISAIIDEYEPETLGIKFENSNHVKHQQIQALINHYKFSFGTGASFRSEKDSLLIFKKGLVL